MTSCWTYVNINLMQKCFGVLWSPEATNQGKWPNTNKILPNLFAKKNVYQISWVCAFRRHQKCILRLVLAILSPSKHISSNTQSHITKIKLVWSDESNDHTKFCAYLSSLITLALHNFLIFRFFTGMMHVPNFLSFQAWHHSCSGPNNHNTSKMALSAWFSGSNNNKFKK